MQGGLPDVARNCTNVNVQAKPYDQILPFHSEIYQYPVCLFAQKYARKICPFCFATTIAISRSFYKKKNCLMPRLDTLICAYFQKLINSPPSARGMRSISLIFTHICNTQFVFVLLISFQTTCVREHKKQRPTHLESQCFFLSNLKETFPPVRIKFPLKPCWGRNFKKRNI